ncbi:MAG: hypothetical protein RJA70_696 [Pseudomonadota bacterium]|jgi:hypothetical protein
MDDENAFGMLFSYHGLEDDEYRSDDTTDFVNRFSTFQRVVINYVAETPPGTGCCALDLGHAIYVEVADGDQSQNLITWLRAGSEKLKEHDLQVACFISHGGRWVAQAPAELQPKTPGSDASGGLRLISVSRPSEPFRRVLYADTASHGLPDEDSAWGPGVYVDLEAVEALGLSLKNRPTTLHVAGAEYFRVGR